MQWYIMVSMIHIGSEFFASNATHKRVTGSGEIKWDISAMFIALKP